MTERYLLPALLLLASCDPSTSTPDDPGGSTASIGIPPAKTIAVNIQKQYPHDTSAYTQGLVLHNGKLYEGTGDFENSSLRITDITTGKVIEQFKMGTDKVFGEGITIFNNKIYQLTWQNRVVNVYDVKNIKQVVQTLAWPHEGWGITHNGTDLFISDGTSNLYRVNPTDLKVKTTIQVVDESGPVSYLNELEFIHGHVWANVYQTDMIVKINPENGHVVGRVNLPGLAQQYFPAEIKPDRTDVLNGIAYDSANKKIYFTGKRWPRMFEATFSE